MNDRDCVRFLQDTLPRLHLRWAGFRRVRRQVCRRLQRRLAALGLADLAAYRDHLARHPPEWDALDRCCRITISRFWRDRGIFHLLETEVLPALVARARARGAGCLRAWSAGCGAGEEPYSLAILWTCSNEPGLRQTGLDILATDSDAARLRRAARACYPGSSLRELPPAWREAAFSASDGNRCLRPAWRHAVRFRRHNLRDPAPDGPFDLVLCRNLAFTYFDTGLQVDTCRRIADVLQDGGLLVLGAHERLPAGVADFEPWRGGLPLYRRRERTGQRGGRLPYTVRQHRNGAGRGAAPGAHRMAIADTVRTHLESRQVDHELVAHPRTHSSRETAAAARVREDHIAKGVLLKDAAGYVLAVIPGDGWIRLHGVRAELGRDLELAPEQDVIRVFPDCDPGAVPCTGTAYGIETVVDEALASLAFVYFEAGDHAHLVRVDAAAFQALTGGLRHGHFSHDE